MKYWNEEEKRLMTEAEMMEAKKVQESEGEALSSEPAPDVDQEAAQDEKPKTSKKK